MRDINQLSAALLSLRRYNSRRAGDSRQSSGVAGSSRWPRRIACGLLLGIVLAYGVHALVVTGVLKRAKIAPAVQLAITNPVQFAKSHVTGGIGAIVLVDPASGLPRIQTVVVGSPAQKAGLQGGDLIVEVDGVPTHGRSLTQNIECIRGIASVGVALTIQRAGTNLNCVIHRSSWSGMGIVQQ